MSDYLFILAEKYIQKAQSEGKFDNLPGHGKPIDLTQLGSSQSEFLLFKGLFKKAKVFPKEVQLLRQIAKLKMKLKNQKELSVNELKKLRKNLNEAQLELALRLEQR